MGRGCEGVLGTATGQEMGKGDPPAWAVSQAMHLCASGATLKISAAAEQLPGAKGMRHAPRTRLLPAAKL